MKKLLLGAVSVLTLVGPMGSFPAVAQDRSQQGDRHDGPGNASGPNNNGPRNNGPGMNNNQNDGRDLHDGSHRWRDTRTDARWDDRQHNGYYTGNTWRFGQPSANARGVSYGYRPWQRGQRLGYYQNRYQEVRYQDERLRRPPRGYHWVRDDRGDFLLAAIATGLIASVILSSNR